MTAYTIGIDIGGTKVAGGVVDASGSVRARAGAQTPHRSTSPAVVEDVVAGLVDRLAGTERPGEVVAVGIGAAGFVSADGGVVTFSPHLSWRGEPLRDAVQARTGLPTTVDNDANASAWAEWRFGAGRGETHLVVVNLGTGIGGGVVLEGRIQRGRHGMAGEFGHMQVVPDGRACECGNHGCWEQYSSGNALVRAARAHLEAGSSAAAGLLAAAGGDPGAVTGPLITQTARAGDRLAVQLLAQVGRWLGVGLANLAAAYDPGTFVVGGGVSAAGPLLLGPASVAFGAALTGRGYRPEPRIVAASLGNEAGLIGAADLARCNLG